MNAGLLSNVRLGTSGYYYKEWEGVLYQPGTPSAEYLLKYSREFDMVELNYSFYRMPDAALSYKMAATTEKKFMFTVKAHRSITHEATPLSVNSAAAEFLRGIEPLADAGKLGAVLMQFPFSFHYTAEARTFVATVCGLFASVPLAIEFRNSAWQRDSVYDGLRSRSTIFVNVDEPDLPGLPRATSLVTSSTGYVRFHGRNKENWWKGDNVTRYNYNYTDAELGEWVPRIRAIALQAAAVLVVFNNHSKGQAVQNARKLREMLTVGLG